MDKAQSEKLQLATAINRAFHWKKTLHYFVACFSPGDDGAAGSVMYRKDEFDALEPRLWLAVNALADRASSSSNQVSGDSVRLSLDYFVNGCTEVPDTDGRTHYMRLVKKLSFNTGDDYAKLMLYTYVLGRTSEGAPFVINALWANPKVPTPWLDEQYPEWQNRWAVAQALELTDKEAQLHYILHSGEQTSAQVQLENINLV